MFLKADEKQSMLFCLRFLHQFGSSHLEVLNTVALKNVCPASAGYNELVLLEARFSTFNMTNRPFEL